MQLASLEILGNVSQHAGKLVRSARQLGRTSSWRFPLSSIGPFSRSFFALRLPLVNSLTSHSLHASAHGRLLRLLLASLLLSSPLLLFVLQSLSLPPPLSLSLFLSRPSSGSSSPSRSRLLYLAGPPTRAGTRRVLVEAFIRRTRVHARTRARVRVPAARLHFDVFLRPSHRSHGVFLSDASDM